MCRNINLLVKLINNKFIKLCKIILLYVKIKVVSH